jgi:hypothetical protein
MAHRSNHLDEPLPGVATLRDPAVSIQTVWIYFDTLHKVGHPDHVRVFATRETAEKWLAEVDPHGTIFQYDVLGRPISGPPSEAASPVSNVQIRR